MKKTNDTDLPHVVVLATGGTIAGTGASDTQMTGYQAGALGVEVLLEAVPALKQVANITGEEIASIDSKDMTEEIMLKLSCRCNELLAQDDVAGIVITHGTDTMEETGYFLHLTVHSDKPVVLTGSMRPATAISADGPANLYNAVKLAVASEAKGRGVMIAMNDEIFSARDVVKSNTENLATFATPNGAKLGIMAGGKPRFYTQLLRKHTVDSEFFVNKDTVLPKVFIIYSHAGEKGEMAEAAVEKGVKGIVYAGMGMGSVHQASEAVLIKAAQQGIAVVRSTRSYSGIVEAGLPQWTEAGFIHSDTLPANKARILLQLGLLSTNRPAELQRMFLEY